MVAALFGRDHAEPVAQRVEQGGAGVEGQLALRPVDAQCDPGIHAGLLSRQKTGFPG